MVIVVLFELLYVYRSTFAVLGLLYCRFLFILGPLRRVSRFLGHLHLAIGIAAMAQL